MFVLGTNDILNASKIPLHIIFCRLTVLVGYKCKCESNCKPQYTQLCYTNYKSLCRNKRCPAQSLCLIKGKLAEVIVGAVFGAVYLGINLFRRIRFRPTKPSTSPKVIPKIGADAGRIKVGGEEPQNPVGIPEMHLQLETPRVRVVYLT